MISTIDILSFDSRYTNPAPEASGFSGPPFSEYLNKAELEQDRTEVSVQTGESDTSVPQGESRVQKKENPAPDRTTGGNSPESKSLKAEAAKDGPPEKSEKSDKTQLPASKKKETIKHTAIMDQVVSGKAGKAAVKEEPEAIEVPGISSPEKLSQNTAGAVHDVSVQPEENQMAQSDPDEPAENSSTLMAQVLNAAKGTDETSRNNKAVDYENRLRTVSDKNSKKGDEKSASGKRPELEIIDARSRKAKVSALSGSGAHQGERAAAEVREGSPAQVLQTRVEGESSFKEHVLVIDSASGREDATVSKSDAAPSRAAGELSRALRDGGNTEILKKAQFMLKDQDKGEIRLILKPEKLGEVRIRLNLTDKHIAGRIIVENSNVRDVFQENMEQLSRTFRDHGFQTSGLEVSVGGRDGQAGERRGRDIDRASAQRMTEVFEDQIPRVDMDMFSDSRVNVYV